MGSKHGYLTSHTPSLRYQLKHRPAHCMDIASRYVGRLRLKCDGTRAENRFRFSAKRTSPFKSAGASVQSTTVSRGVHICSNNAGCTMFRGSVKGTGYLLHSPVSPSLSLPCVTVCRHISTGHYSASGHYTEEWNEGHRSHPT